MHDVHMGGTRLEHRARPIRYSDSHLLLDTEKRTLRRAATPRRPGAAWRRPPPAYSRAWRPDFPRKIHTADNGAPTTVQSFHDTLRLQKWTRRFGTRISNPIPDIYKRVIRPVTAASHRPLSFEQTVVMYATLCWKSLRGILNLLKYVLLGWLPVLVRLKLFWQL